MCGTLILVVGPSGAGKDTLIDAARIARQDIYFPTRVITRPSYGVGEEFRGVELAEFKELSAQDYFAFEWQAHGLSYGIPNDITTVLKDGQNVLFNGSRGMIDLARKRFRRVLVMVVTAPNIVLAKRLAARGREDANDIANRLRRADYAPPHGPDVRIIQNDVPVPQSSVKFLAALPAKRPVRSV